MGDTVRLTLTSREGGEDVIDIDADLWRKFEKKSEEMGVTVEHLIVVALDTYLEEQGY